MVESSVIPDVNRLCCMPNLCFTQIRVMSLRKYSFSILSKEHKHETP